MVFNTAKVKNRKSTKKPGMRGRDAAKELTLKVNISQVLTIDFSETKTIVNHNSHWLDRTKVHRDGRTGKTKSHVPSLCRGILKIPRTMESHLE